MSGGAWGSEGRALAHAVLLLSPGRDQPAPTGHFPHLLQLRERYAPMSFNTELTWSLIIVYALVGFIVLLLYWLFADDDELAE